MSSNKILRFGLPKGSLQEATIQKMAKAGWLIRMEEGREVKWWLSDATITVMKVVQKMKAKNQQK
jgi:cell division septal protein FtsQ